MAAALLSRFGGPRRPVTTIWLGWVLAALLFAALGLVDDLWEVTVLYGLAWFCVSLGSFIWTPLIQRLVPGELLGRVSSVDWLFSLSLSPLGYLAAGVVAGVAGARTAFVIGGVISAFAGAVVFIPGVRAPDRPTIPGSRPRVGAPGM
jgi:hypothetical protein